MVRCNLPPSIYTYLQFVAWCCVGFSDDCCGVLLHCAFVTRSRFRSSCYHVVSRWVFFRPRSQRLWGCSLWLFVARAGISNILQGTQDYRHRQLTHDCPSGVYSLLPVVSPCRHKDFLLSSADLSRQSLDKAGNQISKTLCRQQLLVLHQSNIDGNVTERKRPREFIQRREGGPPKQSQVKKREQKLKNDGMS